METETRPMTVARCMPQSVLYTIWTAKKVLGFVYTARLARERAASASRFNPLPSERLQQERGQHGHQEWESHKFIKTCK